MTRKKLAAITFIVIMLLVIPLKNISADSNLNNYSRNLPWKSCQQKQINTIRSVAFGNGKFVAVGDNGKIQVSNDGSNWGHVNSETNDTLVSVKWNGEKFITIGDNQTMVQSTDGIDWTLVYCLQYGGTCCDIAFNGINFVVVGGGGIWLSSDEEAGMKRKFIQEGPLQGVVWGKDMYVAVEDTGRIFTSKDGKEWANSSKIEGEHYFNSINYFDGMYYAVSSKGYIFASKDALKWNLIYHSQSGTAFYKIIKENNILTCVGIYGVIATSVDGESWYETTLDTKDDFTDIAFGNNTYVVAGFNFQPENNVSTIWYANIGPNNDASLKSNSFTVDNDKCLISRVPENITYGSFVKCLTTTFGSELSIVDKQNKPLNQITKDSLVKVVARDRQTVRYYSIQFKTIEFFLNSKSLLLQKDILFKDSVIMVKGRTICNSLNAKYSYDKKAKKLKVTKGLASIIMTVNSNISQCNGQKVNIPSKVFLLDEPYVPLQFICQKLGYKYTVNEQKGIVYIKW